MRGLRMRPTNAGPVRDAAAERAAFWLAPPTGRTPRDGAPELDSYELERGMIWSWEETDHIIERRPGEGRWEHVLRAVLNVLLLVTVWPAAVLAGLFLATALTLALPLWAPCAVATSRSGLRVIPETIFYPWTYMFTWLRSSSVPIRPT